METELKLPELGEKIESGKVISVLVEVGDTIDIDQPVLEVETDKALIEVPSTVKGKITAIHMKAGEDASIGQLILTVEGENGAAASAEKPAAVEPEAQEEPSETPAAAEPDEPEASAKKPAPAEKESPEAPAATETPAAPSSRVPVPATPNTRRLAREIGVDINQVVGSGSDGRITEEDVKRHSRAATARRESAAPVFSASGSAALPDFSKWGPIERVEMEGIRRATSEGLSRAWATIPHVTQCEKADITEVEKFRKTFGKKAEAAGGKLTVTAILLKIAAAALKAFPKFSASIDPGSNQVIYKNYAHIGVAVDTEHGLLVPVIRDADKKNLIELSVELGEVAERARQRKLTLEEMQGGCITITNLGGFGGTYFTPIVNWPEVAIIGVSRARTEPVYIDGEFRPRLMLPLQVSYDHRLIDGADGIRFLRWIADALENPLLMSLAD